jgi:hypothetical protein
MRREPLHQMESLDVAMRRERLHQMESLAAISGLRRVVRAFEAHTDDNGG